MGDVGSARYEPALLPPYPTIRVLNLIALKLWSFTCVHVWDIMWTVHDISVNIHEKLPIILLWLHMHVVSHTHMYLHIMVSRDTSSPGTTSRHRAATSGQYRTCGAWSGRRTPGASSWLPTSMRTASGSANSTGRAAWTKPRHTGGLVYDGSTRSKRQILS